MRDIRLRAEWLECLQSTFAKPELQQLSAFLRAEKAAGKVIYPAASDFFAALDATPPQAVKVVILGQDPYHGPNQAHGLSFSVTKGTPLPPSLRNIFRELADDLGAQAPAEGDLSPWAEQGVLLLNSVLSVEAARPGSHQGQGWEQLTDHVIDIVSTDASPKVFLLWGAHAQKKGVLIDRERHLILSAPHPSPLSAHRGFLGCRHFSRANAFLVEKGRDPIDWLRLIKS
jgi:uracil-DNA glycosylase